MYWSQVIPQHLSELGYGTQETRGEIKRLLQLTEDILSPIPPAIAELVETRPFQISSSSLSQGLSNFNLEADPNYQEGLRWLLQALSKPPSIEGVTTSLFLFWTHQKSLHSNFNHLGIATRQKNDLFLIKGPTRRDEEVDLVREYVTGLILNELRNSLPTFVYTYSLNYDPPRAQPILAIEYIAGARTLTGFVGEEDAVNLPQAVLDVLIQVVNGLNLAYQLFKFTHYDLHSDNILVKELPEEVSIPLYKNDGSVLRFFKTRYLAVIIDLEYSYVEWYGTPIGVYPPDNFSHYSTQDVGTQIRGDRPNPLADIALLFRNLQGINEARPDVLLDLVELLENTLPLDSEYASTGVPYNHYDLLLVLLEARGLPPEIKSKFFPVDWEEVSSIQQPQDLVDLIRDPTAEPLNLVELVYQQRLGQLSKKSNVDELFTRETRQWRRRLQHIQRLGEKDSFLGANVLRDLEESYAAWRRVVLLLTPPRGPLSYQFRHTREIVLKELEEELVKLRVAKQAYDTTRI